MVVWMIQYYFQIIVPHCTLMIIYLSHTYKSQKHQYINLPLKIRPTAIKRATCHVFYIPILKRNIF